MFIINKILQFPLLYTTFQTLVEKNFSGKNLISNYIHPIPGCRILDIGCGPATITNDLPEDVEYFGIDNNPLYIKQAVEKYPHHSFQVADINHFSPDRENYFDRVIAIGVLHHLNDGECDKLISLAYTALKPGGVFITYDGVFVENQNPIARMLLHMDRGKFVRTRNEYVSLIGKFFATVNDTLRHDTLRLPYSVLITTSVK